MQLIFNRVSGFQRKANHLSALNSDFSYDNVPTELVDITHTIQEDYPNTHETTMALFKRLSQIKEELKEIESLDLHVIKKRIKEIESRIYGYDAPLISRIKDFLVDVDRITARGGNINGNALNELLEAHNFNIKEFGFLNKVYENYTKDIKQLEMLKNKLTLAEKKERLQTEYLDIRTNITTHNIKLVNWCIRRFFNGIPLSMEDAQMEGIEGLVKAINEFDYTLDYHFSTFATLIIVRHIQRHFKELYGMSWLNYINKEKIRKYRSLMLEQDPERKVITPEELSEMGLLDLSARVITSYDQMLDNIELLSSVHEMKQSDYPETIEFEMPQTEEDYELIDEYEDKIGQNQETPDFTEDVLLSFLKNDIEAVLLTLTEKESDILKKRYGLNDTKAMTLDEMAKLYNISRERVRQIEMKAISKLRYSIKARNLRHYLDDKEYKAKIERDTSFYSVVLDIMSRNLSGEKLQRTLYVNNLTNSIYDYAKEELMDIAKMVIELSNENIPINKIRIRIIKYFHRSLSIDFLTYLTTNFTILNKIAEEEAITTNLSK